MSWKKVVTSANGSSIDYNTTGYATNITEVAEIVNGGTGTNTLGDAGILYFTGPNAATVSTFGLGTDGQYLGTDADGLGWFDVVHDHDDSYVNNDQDETITGSLTVEGELSATSFNLPDASIFNTTATHVIVNNGGGDADGGLKVKTVDVNDQSIEAVLQWDSTDDRWKAGIIDNNDVENTNFLGTIALNAGAPGTLAGKEGELCLDTDDDELYINIGE